MAPATQVKYPNSANLFQFCRQILDSRYNGVRVIDQDIGQILNFDPAECSHWKKGKKNIRSIQAIRKIADYLNIDEKLVIDVASGEVEYGEAYYEFQGYGRTEIAANILDEAKKDYYRKNAGTWSKEKEDAFKNYFFLDEEAVDAIVRQIHEKINFLEAPLYLPEVLSVYPNIKLNPVADFKQEKEGFDGLTSTHQSGEVFTISYRAGSDTRPYTRYRIAKSLGKYFIGKLLVQNEELSHYRGYVEDALTNMFATKLLVPANLIKEEMSRVSVSRDVVSQLADIFWVSKSFMNKRMAELLKQGKDL